MIRAARGSRAAREASAAKAGKAAKAAALQPFGAPGIGRLGWLGLGVALVGWAMLLAVAALADAPHVPRSPSFHGDMVAIAQTLIGSGFALAAIGALQSGFGSLDRFFGAVLSRSGGRAASPGGQPAMAVVEPAPLGEPIYRAERAERSGRAAPIVEAVARQRRPYRTLPDGSVEVETILGTRRFATMRDAREFI